MPKPSHYFADCLCIYLLRIIVQYRPARKQSAQSITVYSVLNLNLSRPNKRHFAVIGTSERNSVYEHVELLSFLVRELR